MGNLVSKVSIFGIFASKTETSLFRKNGSFGKPKPKTRQQWLCFSAESPSFLLLAGLTMLASFKSGYYTGAQAFQITRSFNLTFLAEWGDRSKIATIDCRYRYDCPSGQLLDKRVVYFTSGCWRKHAGFKDLTTDGCNCWRLALLRLFSLLLFLSSITVNALLSKMGVGDIF
ncbi:unnamed protein product [Arabidopsis lyrata]|nr:unnamed protein product [Arabidopsis lyrata]